MPEFEMAGKEEPAFRALDEFTQAYVEAMFFTDTETGSVQEPTDDFERRWNPETDSSLPGDVGFYDLAPESLADIVRECARFQETHEALLAEAYELSADGRPYTPERAGHDFWLTRNGHGAGFWDRQFEGDSDIGDRLSKVCGWQTAFGEVWSGMGDDGKVYLSG